MRPVFPLGILLSGILAGTAFPQGNAVSLQGILQAEDRRAASALELRLLERSLASPDAALRSRGLRALGRLERPELAARMLPLLEDARPGVRTEAVQALAQAAQGFRRDSTIVRGSNWEAILGALEARVAAEQDPAVRGMLALSLGRLPYVTPGEIGRARAALLALGSGMQAAALVDVARGMATLARLTARRVPPSPEFLSRSRELFQLPGADPRVRRSALGILIAAQAADAALLDQALRAPDPQLRRVAIAGLARLEPAELRERLLRQAMDDSTGSVRYEALGAWARAAGTRACPALGALTGDSLAPVALRALDLLGDACPGDSSAVRILGAALGSAGGWQRAAHALVSLAHAEPGRAQIALGRALADSVWQRRMYAARAAGLLKDSSALRRLAEDRVANVREAALTALHDLTGHADDARYRAALGATDYQLVLTAARALGGSPERALAIEALLTGLARISRERRETSRDPRVAILVRVRELGGARLAPRLLPYLRDFDPVVAESAAALLQAWTGRAARPIARRLESPAPALRAILALRGARLRFSMASGGVFEVALLVDEAPLTALAVARLAERGYYDGLSFHRVVPNFVIQGGSPGANEYAGQASFLRDELGQLSHERGTLGISTRGRDTGDAQLFINLQDNPRLDYDYTVWGRVVSGMEVVDAVLEGDVIRRVEIRSR